MSLGLVIVVITGDFSKSYGVMRLEARLQSMKEKVGGEEIVTANINDVIEIFDCKKVGKRDGGGTCKKIICVLYIMRDID